MLLHHEVLMALAGFPGNVFMLSKDNGVLEVRLPRLASFVDPHCTRGGPHVMYTQHFFISVCPLLDCTRVAICPSK